MTTPNKIESDIEDLKEDALGNLDPDERARLAVQLRAAGDYERLQQLKDAAPAERCEVTPNLDYLSIERQLRAEALYALWELDTAAWRFLYEARARMNPETDLLEGDAGEEGDAEKVAAELLVHYRAWSRYAAEDVGVPLREFLLHPLQPEGEMHVERIEYAASLADGSAFDADDVGWAPETITADGEVVVDDLVECKYDQIAAGAGGPA